jgi:dTDP-4-amino-4,6-dideoxygalactose transaminase
MASSRRAEPTAVATALQEPSISSEPDEIRFVDLKTQYRRLKPLISARIDAVLEHGAYVNGPEIAELEAALATRAQCAEAVCVASGTDALTIALLGDGIGPGDAVFVPAFTYMATANAVLMAGATPVFVDVRLDCLTLDPADLARRVEDVRRQGWVKPRAVMPVDIFGLPADYPAIQEVAARDDLTIVADAAQSFGASVDGRAVGSLAPMTASSFFPSKPLGCYGDGGALFTSDLERAQRWRSIRTHGTEEDRLISVRHGMNGRLDSLQAAVLLAKLSLFDEELDAREALARLYDSRLSGAVSLPSRPAGMGSSWAVYAVLSDERDRLAEALNEAGVPTARYYRHPLHKQPAFRDLPGVPESLPACESLCRRVLSLPMHAYLDQATAHYICDVLTAALGK